MTYSESQYNPDALGVESAYVKKVLGEPLHHGLCAMLIYQPLDPIDFLANYLRYWVIHVRDYRRRLIAEEQIECFLNIQIPWNISVIAERAKRLEQEHLDEARRIAAEEARRAALERARIKAATDQMTRRSLEQIQKDAVETVLNDVQETIEQLAIKKFEAAEKARIKAEKLARRRRMEEEQEEGAEDEGKDENAEEAEEEEED